ncbi:unnamed protein product [Lactuca saligna]|uniref:Uncharacterized protein n=1 Tax=Lactuca saligna TaxID=75948 RepID=A0AA35VB42_LACSI|nr:unnamed protein product [Lactuca saligna]
MGDKHQWTNEQSKCLVDTCIEEVESVGAFEGCFVKNNATAFSDFCACLLDGNSATDNCRSYSTQSSSVDGASSCRLPSLQITATTFLALDDDGDDASHHASEPFCEPLPSVASPSVASPYTASPSGNPNKRAKPSTVAPGSWYVNLI